MSSSTQAIGPQAIQLKTKSSSSKEGTKVIFGILGSVMVALMAVSVILYIPSNIARVIAIPPFAYGISVLISYIFQLSVCGSARITTISITDLTVLVSTGFASFILFLESIPILKYIGYQTIPMNPNTGEPMAIGSPEYIQATDDEKHLKIQFFSNIVKAVLPVYYTELHKTSLVYMYWMFWMTLLPLYTVLGIQGIC
jgi:hypothetical protein